MLDDVNAVRMKWVGRFKVPIKAIKTNTTDGCLFSDTSECEVIMKMITMKWEEAVSQVKKPENWRQTGASSLGRKGSVEEKLFEMKLRPGQSKRTVSSVTPFHSHFYIQNPQSKISYQYSALQASSILGFPWLSACRLHSVFSSTRHFSWGFQYSQCLASEIFFCRFPTLFTSQSMSFRFFWSYCSPCKLIFQPWSVSHSLQVRFSYSFAKKQVLTSLFPLATAQFQTSKLFPKFSSASSSIVFYHMSSLHQISINFKTLTGLVTPRKHVS
jgi:hypothetical protein